MAYVLCTHNKLRSGCVQAAYLKLRNQRRLPKRCNVLRGPLHGPGPLAHRTLPPAFLENIETLSHKKLEVERN